VTSPAWRHRAAGGLFGACALLALVPLYRARGDALLRWHRLAEIGVLLLAASGWLAAGH
jgi:hypothetical protein